MSLGEEPIAGAGRLPARRATRCRARAMPGATLRAWEGAGELGALAFPATSRLSCPWAAEMLGCPSLPGGPGSSLAGAEAPGSVGVRHIGGWSGFLRVDHFYMK